MTVESEEQLKKLIGLCRDLGVRKLTAFGVSLELGAKPKGMTEDEATEWNETVRKAERGGEGDKEMEFLALPRLRREPLPAGMTPAMERMNDR